MTAVPNVTLQQKIGVTLVQRELPGIQGTVKRKNSASIPSTGRLQPNLKATRWPVGTCPLKYARAQYRAVMTETETGSIFQPMHLILGRMERPESSDQNAAQSEQTESAYRAPRNMIIIK